MKSLIMTIIQLNREKIYRQCTHESEFTEQEIENVRQYLIKRFAKTGPIRQPCKRLHVRKDIKCMSKVEVQKLIEMFKRLYATGFMDYMTAFHLKSWPQVHKYGEGLPWHRWFINEMEKEMMRLDPSVTLPYWNYFTDYAEPHLSIIWDYFGRAGNAQNDYCVPDGPFAGQIVKHPEPHCLRRQWIDDKFMQAWESPEWISTVIERGFDKQSVSMRLKSLMSYAQSDDGTRISKEINAFNNKMNPHYSKMWSQLGLDVAYSAHFKGHLYAGGFNGDFSMPYATNDPIFYLYHAMGADLVVLSWQLSEDLNLVPENYGLGLKYNSNLNKTVLTNLETDMLTDFTNTSIKETFQIGFGELCYIHDHFVRPINHLIKGVKPTVPEAIKRLKTSLPDKLFEKYFPKFALYPNEVTFFDYLFPDVDNCANVCKPMPIAKRFVDTPEGRRVWDLFKNALNLDITHAIKTSEDNYLTFMQHLNESNYCSPYVV
ncbi:uncharacterized protein LOC128959653 [Oppia nitens]|uniref:uncharacterized protein LOC128959653 n=1 Tax=Oppia nitens TaxID=1686743 RepID=UPI0023DB1C14|nr:uncharacterized protein LOC128959653 [Oppia nitens]